MEFAEPPKTYKSKTCVGHLGPPCWGLLGSCWGISPSVNCKCWELLGSCWGIFGGIPETAKMYIRRGASAHFRMTRPDNCCIISGACWGIFGLRRKLRNHAYKSWSRMFLYTSETSFLAPEFTRPLSQNSV